MADWPAVRLGDHVDLHVGFAFKSKEFTSEPEGIRLVRGANIGQGTLKWNQERRFPAERYDEFEKYHLRPGDVVLAMDRPWIDAGLKWAVVSKDEVPALLVQRVARLRGTQTLVHEFVRYVIGSPEFEAYVQPIVTGVNVPHISGSQIEDFRFRLPPVKAQREIASLLGAFDELIENNLRRIAILEGMARLIYREWFVHFRFPGHEDVEFVDSDLGQIPEGWKVTTLGDVSENFDRLRKPLSKFERSEMQGEFPYYGAAKIVDHVNDWIFDGEYLLFAEDGTVVTSDGFPVLQLVNEKFWVNNHTHILRGDGLPIRFLWLAVADYPISGHVTGAAQPKITQANLNRVPVVRPKMTIVNRFMDAINPMVDLLQCLSRQKNVLSQVRDLLLPRLISDELDVSDLDLGLKPVA